MQVGNDFFRAKMAEIPAELRECSVEQWTPTPFMIAVNVKDHDVEIMRWLQSHYGPESSPMHRHEGVWRRSFVTMADSCWLGFKTEELLARFVAQLLTRFQ